MKNLKGSKVSSIENTENMHPKISKKFSKKKKEKYLEAMAGYQKAAPPYLEEVFSVSNKD